MYSGLKSNTEEIRIEIEPLYYENSAFEWFWLEIVKCILIYEIFRYCNSLVKWSTGCGITFTTNT